MTELSVLDLLKQGFPGKRARRWGLWSVAGLAALTGILLSSREDNGFYDLLFLGALAAGALAWSLRFRPEPLEPTFKAWLAHLIPERTAATPAPQRGQAVAITAEHEFTAAAPARTAHEMELAPEEFETPATQAVPTAESGDLFPGLLGIGGLALAVWGELLLTNNQEAISGALVLWLLAVASSLPLFSATLRLAPKLSFRTRDTLMDDARGPWTWLGNRLLPGIRKVPAIVAIFATALAYLANSDNRFTGLGLYAWVIAVGGWFIALWEGPLPRPNWEKARRWVGQRDLTLHLPRSSVALLGILLVAGFFRFYQLDSIPPEMTSDHVEKLLDVSDVLNGTQSVFFPRNTGREPLQFYFAAWIAERLGTGLSFLTLKLSSAIAGFLTIPFIYLLGRELEDRLTGLLAALLASFAFWPTAISRVGLRFPFNPAFAAPALFFVFRGLRRGSRNDFLWAGLLFGAGLYGYSPFRILAVALAAIFGLYLISPVNAGGRVRLIQQFLALGLVALAVFAPLLRFSLQEPEMFWFRTVRRLTEAEASLPQPALQVFLENLKHGLGMFNYRGDTVWVNTIPGRPVLDYVMGGLLILGAAFLVFRLAARRSVRDGFLLLSVPILLLPSTLSLAFPQENPSVARGGATTVVIYLLAAFPLALLVRYFRAKFFGVYWYWCGWAAAGLAVVISGWANYQMYFVEYPAQYVGPAQNASEIGAVIQGFAASVGSYDTAFIRAYPHWADTRAVGIYAGKFGWDQVFLDNDRLSIPVQDPRPKLFILHLNDQEALRVLRQTYPSGQLSQYASARPHHDFLKYFVPGTPSPDPLQPPPQDES